MLSEHLCRFFERFDVAAVPCVGVAEARGLLAAYDPDVVICDYDLLTARPSADWRAHPAAAPVPVVAVSMSKRPGEITARGAAGAGLLYLPTADPDSVRRLLAGLERRRAGVASPDSLPWPAASSVARVR